MKIAHLAAVTLYLGSAAALAQPYMSAYVGTVKANVDCTGTSSCDKTDTGFKLIGGWFFSPKLAVEAGYFDYGKARAEDSTAGQNAEIASSAWGLGVAVHQDLTPDWDLFARLGIARMTTKVEVNGSGLSPWSDSAIHTAPYGGLGVGYRIRQNVALELYWDTIRTKYDKNGLDESANLNMFSVGLSYKF